MNWINGISLVLLLGSAGCCAFHYHKRKQTMERIGEMLDRAMEGDFLETSYDESLFSSVEHRFYRYITSKQILEQKHWEEKETLKELLADISRQTKTPLSNILLYGQLLAEQDLSKEGTLSLRALQNQTEKLSFLISSLVKLSRLETGAITLQPKKGAILPMLHEVAEQFQERAAEKKIRVIVKETAEEAQFDRRWTMELLCNLVDNALKYSPEGESICLRAVCYEMYCCIQVADHGMGIEESEQAKIFMRFYRNPAVREIEGVGNGLYLSRQIAQGQSGFLTVSSEKGEGTVFSLFLPRGQ